MSDRLWKSAHELEDQRAPADPPREHYQALAPGKRTLTMGLSQQPGGRPSQPCDAPHVASLEGRGQPMEGAVLQQMEGRFGVSLAGIRIHADSHGAQLAQSVGAAAFSFGEHIAFAQGMYQPETAAGRALLTHEITHYLQSGRAGAKGSEDPLPLSDAEGEHEAEAEKMANRSLQEDELAGALGQKAEGTYEVRARAPEGRAHRCIAGCSSGSKPKKPSVSEIAANGTVQAALEKAWTESNPDAPNVMRGTAGSTKREQGGWILWNPKDGTYSIQRVPAGDRDGISPGAKPADTDTAVVVAAFHTHPNKREEGYSPEPSQADKDYVKNVQKVPEIIRTHEGIKTIPYP